MAPTKQTELLVATKIAKVLGKATDLTWTVASLKFPIQNVGGNHLHGALRCRHLNILMTSSSRSNCKVVAVRWFFDTFWSIPMKKTAAAHSVSVIGPLTSGIEFNSPISRGMLTRSKGYKIVRTTLFWTSFHFFWTWALFMDLTAILLEVATLLSNLRTLLLDLRTLLLDLALPQTTPSLDRFSKLRLDRNSSGG